MTDALTLGCEVEGCTQEAAGWPGEDGGEVCQYHWEEQCSKGFWEFAVAWDTAFPAEEASHD